VTTFNAGVTTLMWLMLVAVNCEPELVRAVHVTTLATSTLVVSVKKLNPSETPWVTATVAIG
jgi:hypothetical protein